MDSPFLDNNTPGANPCGFPFVTKNVKKEFWPPALTFKF